MVSYTYTGHPQGNIEFNFTTECVCCASTITILTAQQLVDAAREAEDSSAGIRHHSIISAAGKDSLGGGINVGITVTLRDGWQIDSEATSGTFIYTDGNLVQENALSVFIDNPLVGYVYLGAVATSIAETGTSGLTPTEAAQLAAISPDLEVINVGVQKASKAIPHNTDL